MNKHSPS